MKQLFATLLTFFLCLTATAQGEQDFAGKYMELYAKGTSLQCTTVSPLMMQKLLELPDVENDGEVKEIFSRIRSIRAVTNTCEAESAALYEKACTLAADNPKRYRKYAEQGRSKIYIRRRGNHIVEVVLFLQAEQFTLIDLTGVMDEKFLEMVLHRK